MDNLGYNLDTGNLILYGKGNPVDALDVLGRYVMDVHIKDGMFPTDGHSIGKETAIGKGKADFPAILKKLKEIGYNGALTIEREVFKDKQISDILKAREYIKNILETI